MTRRNNVMSPETANAVFDILTAHAGARESQREEFVFHQTRAFLPEFRFGGALGMGGKFWRSTGRRPDGTFGETWYINAYAEDTDAEVRAITAVVVPLLDALRAQHETSNE